MLEAKEAALIQGQGQGQGRQWIAARAGVATIGIAALAAALAPRPAKAATFALPVSIVAEALSETVPTAFAPGPLATADFRVEWMGPAPTGARLWIEENSLEWVRVADVLVVPRARIAVRVESAPGTPVVDGAIQTAGFTQPLGFVGTVAQGVIPAALLSSTEIQLSYRRGHETLTGRARVRFQPRDSRTGPAIWIDSSCSRFSVQAERLRDAAKPGPTLDAEWIYLGCRLVDAEASDHRTSSLELYVIWEGAAGPVRAGGVEIPAVAGGVRELRLRADPGEVRLASASSTLRVKYAVPERLHRASLAAGLGPYAVRFEAPGATHSSWAPVLTLYGSYRLNDTARLVAFDETFFNYTLQSDLGFYLNSESLRVLDRRLGINLMLGAHAIGFRAGGQYYYRFGAPQGIEGVFSDAFARGATLAAGAFIYPPISGKAYYNAWLRWGTAAAFAELNFISWQETIDQAGVFYSRSLGISLGMPLARFF